MKYYITIDCGTTNARAYVVDAAGRVYGVAKKTVGVRDTAVTGSRDTLRAGLREIIDEAIKAAGITKKEIGAVFSSGMITSEIGLCEIPHLMAPCGAQQLADTITKVDDADIIEGVPVYFVRGIKNQMEKGGKRPTAQVGELDFMRGEETQIVGMLGDSTYRFPATVVILSSHTKLIPVDGEGKILGSLTTMSGQLFDAVKDHTFVGKSVEKRDSADERDPDYFDEAVVADAKAWIDQVGLVRALMFPRFLDVLLDTQWYQRLLFYDALVAAEDMRCLGQMRMLSDTPPERFYLIGRKNRCRLYDYILRQSYPGAQVISVSDDEQIDSLSIQGVLYIAKKAGLVQ